jgi:nucleotide-binding universal stress UspA family protein
MQRYGHTMTTSTAGKRRIVVGVDGSPNSAKAIDWAISFAHSGDTVVLLSAWSPVVVPAEMAMSYTFDDTGARTILDEENKRVSQAAANRGVSLAVHFENNDPRNAILDTKSDLIVVGSRGHGGVMGLLLGSVADYVSRHAKVPVVIVPATE